MLRGQDLKTLKTVVALDHSAFDAEINARNGIIPQPHLHKICSFEYNRQYEDT
jgi:hypothetical protein